MRRICDENFSNLMRITLFNLALFWATMLAAFAGGETTSSPTPVGVESLVQEALANNPELRYYQALVVAAEGDRRQAAAWRNPELSVEGGYRRVEDLAGAELPDDGYTVGVSFTQTFEYPGKASLRQAVAAQDVRLARLALDQFRASLAGRVRQLARRYQAAISMSRLTQDISDRSGALVELLRKRALGGARTLLELRVIQASQMELSQAATEARIELEEAKTELNSLLGRKPGLELTLAGALSPPPLAIYDVGRLNQLAARNSPRLRLRRAEIERAELAADAARLAKLPDFAIGPFFSQDVAGERETNIGLSVTSDLPLWDRNEGAIAGAQARAQAAAFLQLQAQREVERAIVQRWRIYQAVRGQLAAMDAETLSNLQRAAELADRQYRQGAISVQLYLESQRALLTSQRIYHDTVLRLWDAQLDLELLTGGGLAPAQTNDAQP